MAQNDVVTIKCGGKTEKMKRKDAEKLYLEAMMCSEGSEQSRYVQIYAQLVSGEDYCFDEL